MEKVRIRIRRKGQITLPVELRRALGIKEGSELIFIQTKEGVVLKPLKKTIVRESAGALGTGSKEELPFATLDSELIPHYYEGKYKR